VLTDDGKAFLAQAGFDPAYGARPLKRAITAHLQNPLAKRLLSGEFADGDAIRINADAAELTFEKA
jgi:ATP-dependent Clp protease ATP-binding subunit ClpB